MIARHTLDSDTVVNTLISINRSQCKLISDLYLKKNDITLEKSIDAVFPRPIALALNIWTKPLGEAAGYLLLNAPDDELFIYYISRLTKYFFKIKLLMIIKGISLFYFKNQYIIIIVIIIYFI